MGCFFTADIDMNLAVHGFVVGMSALWHWTIRMCVCVHIYINLSCMFVLTFVSTDNGEQNDDHSSIRGGS